MESTMNNKIISIAFNQDGSCLAVGNENGFDIFKSNPFKLQFKRCIHIHIYVFIYRKYSS